jgi:hypothetical protein
MGAAQKELAENIYNYGFTINYKSPLSLNNKPTSGKNFNMADYLWNKSRNETLKNSNGLIDIGNRYGRVFNTGAQDM